MFCIKSKLSFTAEFAELAEFNFDFFSVFSAVKSPFDFNAR
jgi:hypothetical protein